MINLKQEKLINAIIFFVKNTKNCRKMKLFKLLYFLDFIHFKKYGTTVTGLEYYAWKRGPVPKKLYIDLSEESQNNTIWESINVIKEKDDDDPTKYEFKFAPKKPLDMDVFSSNEKKIMEDVAFMFKEATAGEMSEITHLKNSPWDKTKKSKGENGLIDYLLAIDEDTTLTVEEIQERYTLEKEFEGLK